ncbi:MAG: homoserine kinase [Calditrichaeota bacterium]|nr:homoserine kinase [Calditrichota bacterium]
MKIKTNLREARSFAPATVTNVGCGFDIMGFAMERPGDEVVVRISDNPGLRIVGISGDDGKIPFNPEKNTAGRAIKAFTESLGLKQGIELEIHKKMAVGTGLGSSAASAVAAVWALNHLLEEPLPKEQLLTFALEGEKLTSGEQIHADNVAACLYGGFIVVRSIQPLEIIELEYPQELVCGIAHPHIELHTSEMRKILRHRIELKDAVRQWGNIAALVAGLQKRDLGIIGRSLQDVIVEPVRSKVIPGYRQAKQAAMDNGALGSGISGSGPSIFALCASQKQAEKCAEAMSVVYSNMNIEVDVYVSKINKQGPVIIDSN